MKWRFSMKNRSLFILLVAGIGLSANVAFAQDLIDRAPIRQVGTPVDWTKISIPPSDPYTMHYQPSRPDNAINIVDEASCKTAGGNWLARQTYNEKLDLYGCNVHGYSEGLWFMVPKNAVKTGNLGKNYASKIAGYTWFVHDFREGEEVLFNLEDEMPFVKVLKSRHDGKLEGASMEWSSNGMLQFFANYQKDKLHGQTARFGISGGPVYIGQYTDGKPTGTWHIYNTMFGSLAVVKNYDKQPEPELTETLGDNERLVWTEEYDPMFKQKKIEGFRLELNDNDPANPGTKFGTQVFYDFNGVEWMKVQFKRDEILTDEFVKKVCEPYSDYSFDHASRTLDCVSKQRMETMIRISFYPTGEIRTIDRMNNDDPSRGLKREEFHTTGEPLTDPPVYSVFTGNEFEVPEGTIKYLPPKDQAQGATGFEAVSNIKLGTGEWTAYWPNGRVREHGSFNQYKRDGEWTFYSENGSMHERIHYSNGRKHGLQERWFGDGMPDYVANYVNGTPDGWMRGYYTLGGIGWELKYKMGSFTEAYREYSGTGAILKEEDMREVKFVNDDVRYPVKLYYPNGKLRASGYDYSISETRDGTWSLYLNDGTYWRDVEYNSGVPVGPGATTCSEVGGTYVIDEEKREEGCYMPLVNREVATAPEKIRFGRWRWWDERGAIQREGELRLGHLYGTWRYYYPGGKPGVDADPKYLMLEGSLECDRPIGVWKGFYLGGQEKFSGNYDLDGKETGTWKTYYENGVVSSVGDFLAGKRVGEWRWYYPNKQLKDQGVFENGLETGTWTEYYENGQKNGEGAFVDGKREGEWTWWREDGTLWRKTSYVKGVDQSMIKK